MVFAYLSNLVLLSQSWLGPVASWLPQARSASGDLFGLLLLLAMAVTVVAGIWSGIYHALLSSLSGPRDCVSRRR